MTLQGRDYQEEAQNGLEESTYIISISHKSGKDVYEEEDEEDEEEEDEEEYEEEDEEEEDEQ